MPLYGLSIVKSVSFRGIQQEFANVYYYDHAGLDFAGLDALAQAVKTNEVQLHGSDVSFKRYAIWSAGGSAGTNVMLRQATLTGTGGQVNNASQDRERAVLIRWPAGIDIRGKPVYLRKWYHSCGSAAGAPFGSTVLQNTAQIPSGDRTTIANWANQILTVSVGGSNATLRSKSGRSTTGPAQCHAYLEHHQLGDAWR